MLLVAGGGDKRMAQLNPPVSGHANSTHPRVRISASLRLGRVLQSVRCSRLSCGFERDRGGFKKPGRGDLAYGWDEAILRSQSQNFG